MIVKRINRPGRAIGHLYGLEYMTIRIRHKTKLARLGLQSQATACGLPCFSASKGGAVAGAANFFKQLGVALDVEPAPTHDDEHERGHNEAKDHDNQVNREF